MTLGDIIRSYRETNNITLGEFANTCSLSKGYISMLENNINPRNNKPISPTLPSMAKVASGMGIDLDTLLKMLDKKQPVQLVSDKVDFSVPTFTIDYQTSDADKKFQQRIALYANFLGLYDQLSSSNKEKVVSYTKGLLSTQQMEEDVLMAQTRPDVVQDAEPKAEIVDVNMNYAESQSPAAGAYADDGSSNIIDVIRDTDDIVEDKYPAPNAANDRKATSKQKAHADNIMENDKEWI